MNYKAKLESGEEILLQNDGDQTRVQLHRGNDNSNASQGTSFQTGKWAKAPTLHATDEGAVLQIETDKTPIFLTVGKNAINRLDEAPSLEGAEKVELKETDEEPSSIKMKSMAPMRPMKPL